MTTVPKPLMRKLFDRHASGRLLAVAICGLGTLSVTTAPVYADDNGSFWTDFIPSEDTRLVFVSSSEGNDNNAGFNPSAPVKTLARAYELLRDGYPDWMLLKRGDVWREKLPSPTKSGRSEDEKMVVGAYGNDPERPKILVSGNNKALQAMGTDSLDHLAYVGLRMEPEAREDDDRPVGIRWLAQSEDILFEDLYISGFSDNIILQAGSAVEIHDIRINGCVVVDSWSKNSHSQGLYASRVNGLRVENSVFDHNGHNEERGAEPTRYNHNSYVQNSCQNVSYSNNIISDASSHGLQMRPGGVIKNNLFISNPLAMLVGGGSYPNEGGVTGVVQNNLVMYGREITPDLPRGIGITLSNIREAEVNNNYFSISTIGYNHDAITVGGDRDLMVTNLSVHDNTILDWDGSISVREPRDGQVMGNIQITRNAIYRDLTPNDNGNLNKPFISTYTDSEEDVTITQNQYHYYQMHDRPFKIGNSSLDVEEWIATVEPTASHFSMNAPPPKLGLDAYLSSIGESGDLHDFISHAREMSRSNPQPKYTAMSVINWFAAETQSHNVQYVD